MTRRYEPFEIRVSERVGDSYPVTAEFQGASWSGTIPSALPLLTAQEIPQAAGWLERGFIDRDYARDFGRRLFQTLFTGTICQGFRTAYERVAAQGGLRIVLTLPAALADLPWELMCDEEGGHGFLARSVTAPLVRHFLGMPLPHRPPQDGPLRILVVTASPAGYPPVSSEEEEKALRQSLAGRKSRIGDTIRLMWRHVTRTRSLRGLGQRLRRRSMADISILSHATRPKLEKRLIDAANSGDDYHVIHFVGHGYADSDGGRLLLEAQDGTADPVPADEFAEMIDEPAVNLAVFNACQTAAAMSLFNSVAQATLRRGVPAVVGMQMPVLDQAAVDFAREFYGAWAAGEPLESALAYARRLMSKEASGAAADWGVPVLLMGPTEGLSLQMPMPPLRWPRWIAAAIGFILITLIPTIYFYRGILPQGPKVMTGTFNVAVAEFGEQRAEGQPLQSSQDGRHMSDQVYSDLVRRIKEDSYLAYPRVEPQHENIGFIQGAKPADREMAARALAAKINATVIIYGTLDTSRTPYVLTPEFYVAESFRGAEELVSENAFGKPIPVPLPLSYGDNSFSTEKELQPRVNAWSLFTLGIAYLHIDKPAKALTYLQQAESEPDAWGPGLGQGKEVVYLFEGAALAAQGGDENLKQAEALFRKALQPAPGQYYARAYLGLGNLLLQRVKDKQSSKGYIDYPLVDQAIIQYTRALTAEIKPSTAYVDIKAYSNLGVAYGYKALNPLAVCPDGEAVRTLEQPVSAYEKSPEVDLLQELGAQGYYRLGRLYEACGDQRKRLGKTAEAVQLYGQAAAEYEHSIAVAMPKTVREPGWFGLPIGAPPPRVDEQDWQRLRWTASHQLAYTYFVRAEMGDPALYDKALALYNDVVKEYETQGARGGNAVSDLLATEAYYNLGLVLERRGDSASAIHAYQRVLQIGAESSPLRDKAQERLRVLGQN